MSGIEGMGALNARLRALEAVGKPVMGLLGLAAIAEQKRLVPRRTGNLGRTIHLGRVTETEAVTIASADYAAAVEYGTKAHEIRPRTKRALRWPAAGSPVTLAGRVRTPFARAAGSGAYQFAARVQHPGTKARPFMVPGAKRAVDRADIAGVIVKAWNEAA